MKAKLHFKSGFEFETDIRGHHTVMDAKEDFGGQNKGPTPKEMLIASVLGCSGMDVVSLMRKMRVPFDGFEVTGEADTTETHPKVFKELEIHFKVTGDEVQLPAVEKSVVMSLSKYCGVSAMISKVVPITYKIFINGEMRSSGKAQFEL